MASKAGTCREIIRVRFNLQLPGMPARSIGFHRPGFHSNHVRSSERSTPNYFHRFQGDAIRESWRSTLQHSCRKLIASASTTLEEIELRAARGRCTGRANTPERPTPSGPSDSHPPMPIDRAGSLACRARNEQTPANMALKSNLPIRTSP